MDTPLEVAAAAAKHEFPAWVIVTLMLAQAVIQPVIVAILDLRRSRSTARKLAAGEPALMWAPLMSERKELYDRAMARIDHLERLHADAEKLRIESVEAERRRMLEHCDERMAELQLKIISELSAEIANGRVRLKPRTDGDSPDERGDSSEDLVNRSEGGAA